GFRPRPDRPKKFRAGWNQGEGFELSGTGTGSTGPSELVIPDLPRFGGVFLWAEQAAFDALRLTPGNWRRRDAPFGRGGLPCFIPSLHRHQCRVPPSPPAIRGMKKPRQRKVAGASDSGR